MRNPRYCALWALFAAGTVAPCARAGTVERGRLQLQWEAPPGCPGGEVVLRSAEELYGGPLEASEGDPVQFQGVIAVEGPDEASGDQRVFRLDLRNVEGSGGGTRILRSSHCAELAQAAAMVLALSLNSKPAEEDVEPEDDDDVAPPTPQVEVRSAAAAVAVHRLGAVPVDLVVDRPPPASSSSDWSVAAGIVTDLGTLPSIAMGPEIQVGRRFSSLAVRLAGIWLPPQRHDVSAGKGGIFSFVGATLSACALRRLPLARSTASTCAGPEIGTLRAEGRGTTIIVERSALWSALFAEAEIEWRPVDPIALVASMAPVFAFSQPKFALSPGGTVHQPGPIQLRLALAGRVAF